MREMNSKKVMDYGVTNIRNNGILMTLVGGLTTSQQTGRKNMARRVMPTKLGDMNMGINLP